MRTVVILVLLYDQKLKSLASFLDCPPSSIFYGNKCYKLVTEALAWDNAQEKCELEGGNLASIPDQDTNEFLISMMDFNPDGFVWVGGRPDWQWADGTPFTYKSNLQTECESELSVTLLGTDHTLLIQF